MTVPRGGTTPEGDEQMARLARDLAEAVEQQAATSQVLEVMGRSPFALEGVFETVVRHAVRLCGADAGFIHRREGELFRMAKGFGGSPAYQEEVGRHPVTAGPGTLVGRVAVERNTVQIPDVLADADYTWRRARDLGRVRTLLGVPMLSGDEVLGVITLSRETVAPFDDRTVDLVTTFAAQGAIAIEHVRLVTELERREQELTRVVDELRALSEISEAVTSSLELEQVLRTVVARAVQLSGAEGGSVFEFDPEDERFRLRACFGTEEPLVAALRDADFGLDGTFVGQAVDAGRARQGADLEREPDDPHVAALLRAGWRALLAVPLRRDDAILGALTVRRRSPGAFPERTVELVRRLAEQSTVAIHNARLFHELEDKSRQLEIAGRHKSEFLASMSHELRTPLNAVIGFSDVLLERLFGELNERQDEYVRDIRSSGRHLLELINEILDLSKVEAGRMELERSSVVLADLLEQSTAMVRERATRRGVELGLEVATDVGLAWGDELRLKQVLLNLLSNAVKFTEAGGTVRVEARRTDDEVLVEVVDTGVGIPEEDQERIFEAFQRGDRPASRSPEGTGLGLTLSRRIVDLHGGRMWMSSRVGEGSTFGFSVPVARQPVAPHEPDPDAAERTILVVEDDRRSADLLRLYLESDGFAVATAQDGVEGLEQARRLMPRAIILDLLLPRLDGWHLLAALKEDPATARIPVLIVSMLDERGRGFALGAADYLVKPVRREEILKALARAAPPSGTATVVVIDDEPVDQDLAEAMLASEGYRVLRATGGREGVELVRGTQPAVVLLDLVMPDVDGFEVVDRLRADPATAHVPIVVLTAKDMSAADCERLNGRISHLAQKATLRRRDLVELVGRLVEPEASRP